MEKVFKSATIAIQSLMQAKEKAKLILLNFTLFI